MLTEHPRVRLVVYLVAIAAQVASFFVTIYSLDLATAFSQTSDVLATLALATAASNLPKRELEE